MYLHAQKISYLQAQKPLIHLRKLKLLKVQQDLGLIAQSQKKKLQMESENPKKKMANLKIYPLKKKIMDLLIVQLVLNVLILFKLKILLEPLEKFSDYIVTRDVIKKMVSYLVLKSIIN